jgi:copper chaperone CopZ
VQQLSLRIAGMHCGGCVQTVRDAITGVHSARVDRIQIGSATVTFDEHATNVGAVIDAVYDAGYEAEEMPHDTD